MDRLYVIVRSDLSPGMQLAQACHAARAFGPCSSEENLVVLHAPDELALTALAHDLELAGLPVVRFVEPDLGHQLTAISAGGAHAKRMLRALPLAA